jgi:hypothetical protein
MKRVINCILILVFMITVTACGSENSTEKNINNLELFTETDDVMKVSEAVDTPKASGISGIRDVNGFDLKTNQMITWCGINFSFPAYFNVLHDDSTETWITYYPKEEDYYASLMFQSEELSETQELFNLSIPYIVESTLGGGPFANADIIKSEEISIAGLPGWIITFSITDPDGIISTGSYSFVYNINAKKVAMITCGYDSKDQSQYDYLGDFYKVLETAKLLIEPLDLNAINNTNSSELDMKFVGKVYSISGIVDQAIKPSEGFNALVIIQPDIKAKGMGSDLPLEINIWLSSDEFEAIGGITSVGKQIDLSARLTSIGRNAISKDPAVKGYPIQLEFDEYE